MKILGACSFLFAILCALPVSTAAQSTNAFLSVTRELLITPESGDFSYIGSILPARGGTMVVTQPQDNTIRFYSPSGKLLGTFGRPGSGPGEFRYVGLLGEFGDTLSAPDAILRRVTLFSVERVILGTRAIPTSVAFRSQEGAQVTFFDPYPLAAYSGGSILVNASSARATTGQWPPPPHVRGESPFVLVAPDGTAKKIVAWQPSSRSCSGPRVTIPFCQEPLDAISADGKRIAFGTVEKGTLTVNRLRVVVLTESGDTVFSRTLEVPFRRIPVRVVDSTRAAMALRASSQVRREEILGMRIPESYPSFKHLLLGRDATIWIELHSESTDREWLLLGPRGNQIGRVRLPRNVSIKAASRNYIWGVIENDDGELGLVRYAVQ